VAWARLTRARRARAPYLRIAFHPVDAARPEALAALLDLCSAARQDRRIVTYEQLVRELGRGQQG
jgi:hypothetical protein